MKAFKKHFDKVENDARDRREERAHFILENKGFALENEAKKRPKTKNTLEVSSKTEEKPEMHAYKRRRGAD